MPVDPILILLLLLESVIDQGSGAGLTVGH